MNSLTQARSETRPPAKSGTVLDVFPDLASLHQAHPDRYPHLLESVTRGAPQSRHDILFAFPGPSLTLHAGDVLTRDGADAGNGDFLEAFEREWRAALPVAPDPCGDGPELPFRGGWFLYLGYELAAQIEPRLAGRTPADGSLPVARATRFPAAIIRDHATRRTHLVCETRWRDKLLPQMHDDVHAAGAVRFPEIEIESLAEDDARQFMEGVQHVLEYIRAGDVFQVNLSREWQAQLRGNISACDLYLKLRVANPAPFAGLMSFERNRAVVSSSPERLVSVSGRTVRTRPIAGTYPRSSDMALDQAWSRELLQHPKERAEHVMLLDLERNDLGRICQTGSVHVSEFMALESYRHVHHIVSEVKGELRHGMTPSQVIRAVFPGGTITGCPKVRCMEIIAELERLPRGAYTGSMGYVNHDGSMDLNILIRTMVQNGNTVKIRAGAGIVADSIPARELQETRAKARGLLSVLDRS